MNFIVGLTGGIGSGKTTVANLFGDLGAAIVDTDAIAHELTSPQGSAMEQIIEAFGPDYLDADGGLERAAMRQLCFSSRKARHRLEGILHPMIRHESLMRCQQTNHAQYVLLVVPLLAESKTHWSHINRILVVDCDESFQISRVMARNGLTAEEVQAIMATQASRENRLAIADDVIVNAGRTDDLSAQVYAHHCRYVEFAQSKPM